MDYSSFWNWRRGLGFIFQRVNWDIGSRVLACWHFRIRLRFFSQSKAWVLLFRTIRSFSKKIGISQSIFPQFCEKTKIPLQDFFPSGSWSKSDLYSLLHPLRWSLALTSCHQKPIARRRGRELKKFDFFTKIGGRLAEKCLFSPKRTQFQQKAKLGPRFQENLKRVLKCKYAKNYRLHGN